MAGAISTHAGSGLFMNWFGTLPAGSEGFEYHPPGRDGGARRR
jgi:putative oxidoreductase